MGAPMILYGLAPVANSSFENGTTGWDITTLRQNGESQISADQFQSAGDGIPSVQSLEQDVEDGTAGNKAVAAQRFRVNATATSDPTIENIFQKARDGDQEFAVAVSLHPETGIALLNSDVRLRFYEEGGATMTVGSGVEVLESDGIESRKFTVAGPDWYTVVRAIKIPNTVVNAIGFVDIELRYDVDNAGFDGSSVYWDRVFFGVLCDLSKGVVGGLSPRQHLGMILNEGDGTAEIIKVHGPSCDVRAAMSNIMRGSPDDRSLLAFGRWMANVPGFFALWINRDHNTNNDLHFQRAIIERQWNPKYPAGVLRRNFTFRFFAPNEGLG